MKTIDDALELRRRIFGAFEMAEVTTDPAERERWLTVVIVGAGPTGVELAGQVRELAVRCLKGEFRTFDPASVRVLLLDGGKEPLATFGDRLSGKATKQLERLGVELRMNARVVGVDAFGVDVLGADGAKSRIDAHTTIWAAGVQASPLAAKLAEASGAEIDRAGRIAVLPDLTLPGHPEVFAVGDMATVNNLPGVAEVAMQGGLHAANTIWRRSQGKDVRALQVPRHGQRGHDRAVPRHRQRAQGPPQRVPGLGGVVLRPPRLPHRLRRPLHDDDALAALDDRARSCRAGVQRRPHRGRPQPSRVRPRDRPTGAVPERARRPNC